MNALLLAAWIGCQALDGGTTFVALQHGYQEGNAVLRGPQLYSVKISANVGMLFYHRHVQKDHPNVIPATMAAAGCLAGGMNLKTMSQR